jgi:hypothetical protein
LHAARNANAARIAQCLQPSSDVDAVAENILAIAHDVALMYADAEHNASVRGCTRVPLGHLTLDLDSALHGFDRARKLDEQAVAGSLDNAPAAHSQRRIDHLTPRRFDLTQGLALVLSHEAAVADNIGDHNGCKTAQGSRRFHYRSSLSTRSAVNVAYSRTVELANSAHIEIIERLAISNRDLTCCFSVNIISE